eukprot:scaffold28191_cov67-Skeletonema_dohrnii-CCMP3373.AAC.1
MELIWSLILVGLYCVSVRTEPMDDLMTVSMSSIAKDVSVSMFVEEVAAMARWERELLESNDERCLLCFHSDLFQSRRFKKYRR